jgi:hypothetical protein
MFFIAKIPFNADVMSLELMLIVAALQKVTVDNQLRLHMITLCNEREIRKKRGTCWQ